MFHLKRFVTVRAQDRPIWIFQWLMPVPVFKEQVGRYHFFPSNERELIQNDHNHDHNHNKPETKFKTTLVNIFEINVATENANALCSFLNKKCLQVI